MSSLDNSNMQCNSTIGIIFLIISVLTLHQRCDAAPAEQREIRQTKGPNNSDTSQADVKALSGQLLVGAQLANQPLGLTGFGGTIGSLPYGRYGGLPYGASGYPGGSSIGLIGLPFGGGAGAGISSAPGISALQLGNTARLGYTPTANYMGNNLPPILLNGPEMYADYMFSQLQNNFGPAMARPNNIDNLLNMVNLQGVTGTANTAPYVGAQMPPTQSQLLGQASQLQPQLGTAYSFPSTFVGQLGGYGPGSQAYQML